MKRKVVAIGCGLVAGAIFLFLAPWIVIGIAFFLEDVAKERAVRNYKPTSLETAVRYKYATREMVAGFIDRGGDVNGKITPSDGASPVPLLATAAATNNVDVTQLLIERGARVDDANLWAVLRQGQDEMALMLIGRGASLGPSASAEVEIGPELIQAAAFGRATASLDALLARHADPHVRNGHGASLLELAIETESMDPGPRSNSAETTKRLLAAGVDPNVADEIGTTPLHWAAYHGKLEEIEMLLAAGAKLEARGRNGSTPLSVAVERCQPEAVQLLLQKHASRDVRTPEGLSLTDGACYSGYPELNKKNKAKIAELLKSP